MKGKIQIGARWRARRSQKRRDSPESLGRGGGITGRDGIRGFAVGAPCKICIISPSYGHRGPSHEAERGGALPQRGGHDRRAARGALPPELARGVGGDRGGQRL